MTHKIEQNIKAIKANIIAACESVGRAASDVKLVAVSKTVGLQEIDIAAKCGVTSFGENRTAMLVEKHRAYPQLDWHFIGRIQTNKIKDFVGKVSLVHSVASQRALLAIDKQAAALQITQDVLLEVNTSNEESKDGLLDMELDNILQIASGLENIRVKGLMTMAAAKDCGAASRSFANLRQLRDNSAFKTKQSNNIELSELSMGMSEDFALAIAEGATIVRIGRHLWQ